MYAPTIPIADYVRVPYIFEYKLHFFVTENQSENRSATYTQG